MFILGNFVQAIAAILGKVLTLYTYVLVASVLMSWISPDPFNPIVQFIRAVTQPFFDLIRRVLPFTMVGMFDLAPLVAFLLIQLVQMAVIPSLYELGVRLR